MVRQRAAGRCEYCLVHEDDPLLPHEPDHIIAEQHGGATEADNLAYACFQCNRAKGPNIASLDSETGDIVPLFHPRRERWDRHFRLDGVRILPLTPTGRATVALLHFNSPERLQVRLTLQAVGRYPLEDAT